MFFTTSESISYPLASIVRIGRGEAICPQTGMRFRSVELTGAKSVRVLETEVGRILSASTTILPAEPGTRLLTYRAQADLPADQWWLASEPIIGWRVGAGEWDFPEPVLLGRNWAKEVCYQGVETPDGRVQDFEGQGWSDSGMFAAAAKKWVIADRADSGEDAA